ncbi:hypothetical protein [Actinophytocola sp.]|uniref:hypothetical protein n=1 Tax=Actinophytocola sp. TaxID=1872138 RepID=UPI002D5F5821|nr:hypothetical protein [Actinophytocola sp.]HYQ64329.1 hypothetical protein [Actinophytocola sp.]
MYLAGDIASGVDTAFTKLNKATAAITSGTFTVTRDNVLAAGRIVESQADALQKVWQERRHDLRIQPPGTDDVSIRMAKAWNEVLVDNDDSYDTRIREYVLGLKKLAVQLGDAAKTYGYTEDQIATAFGKKGA